MFRITKVQEQTHIYYEDHQLNNYATFILEEGGRLSSLTLDGKPIIANPEYASYQEHYGGAILFPFVNRIENGKYHYNDKEYQLKINDKELNNAHHGLAYNKSFRLRKVNTNDEKAVLKLSYEADGKEQAFPFKYNIELLYQIEPKALSFSITIIQKDTQPFPYTIGWHPYFLIAKDEIPELFMDVIAKAKINRRGVAEELEAYKVPKPFKINHLDFDDCYQLASKMFFLVTKAYQIKLETSFDQPFLQIYTPADGRYLALEPATGLSNSFNHQIGLKTLEPEEQQTYSWTISLED
jgi:aldose 1-epimerase